MDYQQDILECATEVLGSRERAEDWVGKKSRTLGDKPENLYTTKDGYEKVLKHLHKIDTMINRD